MKKGSQGSLKLLLLASGGEAYSACSVCTDGSGGGCLVREAYIYGGGQSDGGCHMLNVL